MFQRNQWIILHSGKVKILNLFSLLEYNVNFAAPTRFSSTSFSGYHCHLGNHYPFFITPQTSVSSHLIAIFLEIRCFSAMKSALSTTFGSLLHLYHFVVTPFYCKINYFFTYLDPYANLHHISLFIIFSCISLFPTISLTLLTEGVSFSDIFLHSKNWILQIFFFQHTEFALNFSLVLYTFLTSERKEVFVVI